jgi:hypothetical protein
MSLVPYTITALAESDAAGTGGRNIVIGAVVTLQTPAGGVVTMYDDAAGANPSTAKTTGAKGFVTVFVEPGEYQTFINGNARGRVVVADAGFTDALAATGSDVLVGGQQALAIEKETTVSVVASGVYPVGARLIVTDRAKAKFNVVSGGTANGFDILNAGSGKTAVLQVEKNIHNIVAYGAVGGASPTNNAAIQRAADQASASRGKVYTPFSIVPYVVGVHLPKSNVIYYGDGIESSTWQRRQDMLVTDPMIYAIGGGADPSLNVKNLYFRDMRFLDDCVNIAFSQFSHLVSILGGTNIEFKDCKFEGFIGDGIYVFPGNPAFQYKNKNIRVLSCIFDGLNNNNRNAISILDVNNMLIKDCEFYNCTRPDMPGAIDIEPNTGYDYVTLKKIRIINNKFKNIQGTSGAVGMYCTITSAEFLAAGNVPPSDILVKDNEIDGCNIGLYFTQFQESNPDDTFPRLNLRVHNNVIKNGDIPVWVYGIRAATFRENEYHNFPNRLRVGWNVANRGVSEVSFIDDVFFNCGNTSGYVISLYQSRRVDIVDCTFDKCGSTLATFGNAVEVAAAPLPSARVRMIRNRLVNNAGAQRITAPFGLTGTLTDGGNVDRDNDWAGLTAGTFVANESDESRNSFTTGITASSTQTQAAATLLSARVNEVSTVATSGNAVKLPLLAVVQYGGRVSVLNSGANPCKLFPNTGNDLGAGSNTEITLAVGEVAEFMRVTATRWARTA